MKSAQHARSLLPVTAKAARQPHVAVPSARGWESGGEGDNNGQAAQDSWRRQGLFGLEPGKILPGQGGCL